jgi:hypothetical protein
VQHQDGAAEVSSLMKRIAQLERDQKADEARIDAAIKKAESEISVLEGGNATGYHRKCSHNG